MLVLGDAQAVKKGRIEEHLDVIHFEEMHLLVQPPFAKCILPPKVPSPASLNLEKPYYPLIYEDYLSWLYSYLLCILPLTRGEGGKKNNHKRKRKSPTIIHQIIFSTLSSLAITVHLIALHTCCATLLALKALWESEDHLWCACTASSRKGLWLLVNATVLSIIWTFSLLC